MRAGDEHHEPNSNQSEYGFLFYDNGDDNVEPRNYDARPMGRSLIPVMVKNFIHVNQTGSRAHSASYPMRTRGLFPRE
jgi:hypothetical protein